MHFILWDLDTCTTTVCSGPRLPTERALSSLRVPRALFPTSPDAGSSLLHASSSPAHYIFQRPGLRRGSLSTAPSHPRRWQRSLLLCPHPGSLSSLSTQRERASNTGRGQKKKYVSLNYQEENSLLLARSQLLKYVLKNLKKQTTKQLWLMC